MTDYNLNWLVDQYDREECPDYFFFWGHTPGKQIGTGKHVLSQWYPSPFVIDGITYKTAEHWMMAQKARLFGDLNIFEQIINAASPKEAKALGRQVAGFSSEKWEAASIDIVVKGNVEKFSQHPDCARFLLSTGNKILVEASPVDIIWGNGLPEDHINARNPKSWRGENLLGFALMEVRDRLRE